MDQPWSGSKLHFVGIGGAGMSGLAVVAQRSARRHRLGSRRRLAVLRRCARPASSRRSATTAANVPAGAEVVYSTRDPAGQPRAHDRRARAAPRRPARRAHAAEADDRRLRHPRQDDDLEHARPRAARRPELPGRRRGPLARARTPAGARASGWSSRPTSPTAGCSSCTRRSRSSPTPSSTTTRPTPPRATSTTRSARSSRARRGRRSSPPEPRRPAAPERARPSRATFDGVRRSRVPGAHNARNAAAALTAIELAGRGRRRRPQRARATSRAPAAASSASARPPTARRVVDDYAHHPTEVAATIEAARTLGAAPRRRALPAAPVQPHPARGDGVRRARSPQADLAVVLDVYPARERQEDYPGVTGLLVAEAPPTPARGKRVVWARDHATAEAVPAQRVAARATCC